MIPIPRDFREFFRLLNKHRVKYLVIGGYAVGYHGYPRYTGDVDIFVAVSRASGRHKDLQDIEVLQSHRRPKRRER
jgi:hypothetical protein